MNRNYKTKAVIIKQYEVGETDRIYSALSLEFGKITLKARGVRKILAKLKGHLDLLTHVQIEAHRSSSGSIDTIIGAETIYPFNNIRKDLESTSRLYLILEFLNRVLPEREPHPKIFEYLLYLLQELEEGTDRARRLIITSYFLLRSLKELGFAPHLRQCVRCRAALKKDKNYFDFLGAGIVCSRCFDYKLKPISNPAIIVLRILSENKKLSLPKIKIKNEIIEEANQLLENYVEYVLETELRSKKFVAEID